MKKLFLLLFFLLVVGVVSAQGFTVVINGTPFSGVVDGEPDAALLEAAALAEIPGLDVMIEGTQVKFVGKDIPSTFKQDRVMVEARALTKAVGGLYEVTDTGRTVKLTWRNLSTAAQPGTGADAGAASAPNYTIKYSGPTAPEAEKRIFEAGMSKLLYGIATSNRGMMQSVIPITCHIHGQTPGDPVFTGLKDKNAQIGKVIELLGGQSPGQIKATYLPRFKAFTAIVKYSKKEIQLQGSCGKQFSVEELGIGPLTRF